MHRLAAELQRLYLPAPATDNAAASGEFGLVGPDGRVRGLVLELARPADWPALRPVWEGVQAELDLPAPGIAVNGVDGYQLWFSLEQAVPLEQARRLLEGLRQRYLATVQPDRLGLWPTGAQGASTRVMPPRPGASGEWSAFVTPDLAAVFGDEPCLDLPPGDDAQADLLSRLKPIKPEALERALLRLWPQPAQAAVGTPPASAEKVMARGDAMQETGEPMGAAAFLRSVMNDPGVPLALRIEAAKALLPHERAPG